MTTPLQELLNSIDPSRTIDEIARQADRVMNSFPPPPRRIEDWEGFQRFMVRFFRHVSPVFKCGAIGPACGEYDEDWIRCSQILARTYDPLGRQKAFELARSGADGGIYRVMKDVIQNMIEYTIDTDLSLRIQWCLDSMSPPERVAVLREYLDEFKRMLPPDVVRRGIANLPFFGQILRDHVYKVKHLREIGRS